MRNILAAVGAAVVAFLAVGWYLGWYQISSSPSAKGPQSVQVDINPTKITEDVKTGVEKGEKIVDSLRQPGGADGKAAAPAAKDAPKPTSPADPTGSSNGWLPIGGRGPKN